MSNIDAINQGHLGIKPAPAASTLVAEMYGLPVSTTQVLSFLLYWLLRHFL